METHKLRILFEYEFRRGTNAAQTARNINAVYGENTTNRRTVSYWFTRFRNGNFNLRNELRGNQVDKDVLRAMVKEDPHPTPSELADWFHVSLPTIVNHLREIGKIDKV